MANEPQTNMYGYASDDVAVSPFNFGLNASVTTLEKFEWIPNGGKDGAEQEALEIIFKINGTDKSYRRFPVTQGFDSNGQAVTDPNSSAFKDAVMTFNSIITHILHCFVDSEKIKTAMTAQPITSFKQFCQVSASLLPANFREIKLDIFMQYQWTIRAGQNRTYLEIPQSMKSGKWLCPAIPPVGGEWKEVRKENPSDNDQKALTYVDGAGNYHLFTRYGRYMKSNSANQQKTEDAASNDAAAANISHGGAAPTNTPPAGSTAASW